MNTIKIISYNIGIKIDNASQVAGYLETQKADIICLQEVMRPLESNVLKLYRSGEEILDSLKKDYPYYFFAPEWVADKFIKSTGGGDRDFGGMVEQGKLILSKYPITHGYNYFYYKNYEFDRDRTKFYAGDDHGRALQVVEAKVNNMQIQIGNVHGSYSTDKIDTEKSLAQSQFIIKKMQERELPSILLGDFNVLPDTKSISMLNEKFENLNKVFNITSTRPDGKMIDYIFISKELKPKSLGVDNIDASDHYPLMAEIKFS